MQHVGVVARTLARIGTDRREWRIVECPDRFVSSAVSATPAAPSRAASLPWWCLLGLVLVAVQGLLLANPGYFSHDELQWAAFADAPGGPAWVPWFDVGAFQYRPLTFNAWLVLSQLLFERPPLFHALWVVLGSANALLLAGVLRGAGAGARVAAGAALVFVLNPYAAYVHGWVATLADLLWVGFGVVAVLLLQWRVRVAGDVVTSKGLIVAALIGCAATVPALLAKEAAIVFPALAVLVALLGTQRRVWFAVAVGSGVAVLAYLVLRLGVVLDGATPDGQYAWHPWHVPRRWFDYLAFLGLPRPAEVQSLALASTGRLLLAALLPAAVLVVLWRAGWRDAVAWLVGGAAALGPVLILAQSANQYGYGFSAVCVGVVALAWPRLHRIGRAVVSVAALVVVVHGVDVQRHVLQAGQRQAVFSPALVQALADVPGPAPIALHAPPRERWLYARLLHDVPTYLGTPIGNRVVLVDTPDAADAVIESDGRISRRR